MKTVLNLALLSIILSLSSIPIGIITGKVELFATITLIFMYIGLILGLAAWHLLIREWDREEKSGNKKTTIHNQTYQKYENN